jgi:hypothetical protein
MNSGVGVQKNKLKNIYGIGGIVETPLKKLRPFLFTKGLDVGINGLKNMPYELKYNGTVTNTNVQYTSYVVQLSSGLKYLLRQNKKWTPYAALTAGALSYYTEMSIEDSRDPYGCSPIETKPVSFSMIVAGTAETGIRIKTKEKNQGSVSFIEAGVGYVAGTKGKYLRLDNKHTHNPGEGNYQIQFKQNSTGQMHEHSIGTSYRTTTSQLQYHISFAFPF